MKLKGVINWSKEWENVHSKCKDKWNCTKQLHHFGHGDVLGGS